MRAALVVLFRSFGPINVATGGRISLNRLLRAMNALVGTNLAPIYDDVRQGEVKESQADISKAQTLLGYRPIVSLEEGLKHTLGLVPIRARRTRRLVTSGVTFPDLPRALAQVYAFLTRISSIDKQLR